ncbi:MAG: WxcM-like domain-containing protein [Candidatus Azambacteria bacterium]|nr:WxcM-like domain-containing protein [Candidatus Azambacteria bacterium]
MPKKIKYKIKELEIHSDNRGWLVELLKANQIEKPVKQIHISSIKPGQARANHYHSKRIEWFFIVAGKAELFLQDIKTKEKISFKLSQKKPKVITIFPYVAHAVRNAGKETVYLVAAQSDIYNPKNPDAFYWDIR